MNNDFRKIGWLWQWDFLRPLFWKEYQHWVHNVLPLGWSIISEPEEDADESDYENLVGITKRLPTDGFKRSPNCTCDTRPHAPWCVDSKPARR